jgi:hypothetical protein
MDSDLDFALSSCAGRSASKTRVNALVTRASIFFARRFLRKQMVSGPAMTTAIV